MIVLSILALPTMEAFSLLRYWKNGGGATLRGAGDPSPTAAVSSQAMHSGNDEPDNDNDLFDLEFTVPDDDDDVDESEDCRCESVSYSLPDSDESDEGYIDGNFEVSNDSSKLSLSNLPAPPLSLLNKSATRFRVFFLGFKKTKTEQCIPPRHGKLFAVKFNVDETPTVSMFAKENRGSKKPDTPDKEAAVIATSEEKNIISKEGVQKYLKKMKPLYVKISKREKARLSRGLERASKKSTSDTASIVLPSDVTREASKRRDDSLLQQHDGIQGAILHCKRSFNASPDFRRESDGILKMHVL